MDDVALHSAERLVETLGTMKGAAMKMGQLASFIDTDYLPDEYRELYQEKLGTLRNSAPPMPWDKVRKVLDQAYDEPYEELFERIEPEAVAAASIGQVHRGALHDGREVAVKIQYPGIDAAIRADLSNAGMILRLTKALAPGLDAKAVAAELRERVLEELDYEHEAQNQRSFARAYRGHPFIHVPDVVTRLLTRQGARHRVRQRRGLRAGEAAGPGGAQPLRGDRLSLLPRLDLPAQPLQRGCAPRQLRAARRREGRVPRLRHDQAPRPRADPARGGGRARRVSTRTPSGSARSSTSSASCATRSASTRSS